LLPDLLGRRSWLRPGFQARTEIAVRPKKNAAISMIAAF
jgi:hypothetical protein